LAAFFGCVFRASPSRWSESIADFGFRPTVRLALSRLVEHEASFELCGGELQILDLLVVVALRRGDRCVSEQIAHLRERHAAFDEP